MPYRMTQNARFAGRRKEGAAQKAIDSKSRRPS